MRIYNLRLAHFPELPPIMRPALRLHPHLVKHAPATSWRGKSDLAHASHLQTSAEPQSIARQYRCSAGAPVKHKATFPWSRAISHSSDLSKTCAETLAALECLQAASELST